MEHAPVPPADTTIPGHPNLTRVVETFSEANIPAPRNRRWVVALTEGEVLQAGGDPVTRAEVHDMGVYFRRDWMPAVINYEHRGDWTGLGEVVATRVAANAEMGGAWQLMLLVEVTEEYLHMQVAGLGKYWSVEYWTNVVLPTGRRIAAYLVMLAATNDPASWGTTNKFSKRTLHKGELELNGRGVWVPSFRAPEFDARLLGDPDPAPQQSGLVGWLKKKLTKDGGPEAPEPDAQPEPVEETMDATERAAFKKEIIDEVAGVFRTELAKAKAEDKAEAEAAAREAEAEANKARLAKRDEEMAAMKAELDKLKILAKNPKDPGGEVDGLEGAEGGTLSVMNFRQHKKKA